MKLVQVSGSARSVWRWPASRRSGGRWWCGSRPLVGGGCSALVAVAGRGRRGAARWCCATRLTAAAAERAAPEAAPELHRLARTLDRWRAETNTSVATGTHNGRTEAANAKIKDVKRSARGFRNFSNYRPRILLAAGQNPAKPNPPQKSEPHAPASSRRAA